MMVRSSWFWLTSLLHALLLLLTLLPGNHSAASKFDALTEDMNRLVLKQTPRRPTKEAATNPNLTYVANMVGDFASGGLAGVSAVGVGYPFDLAKVQLQTHKYTSMHQALLGTAREGGLRALYRGASIQFCVAAPMLAVSFLAYINGQALYSQLTGVQDIEGHMKRLDKCIFGSLISSLTFSLVVIPADRTKVEMQTNTSAPQAGASATIRRLYDRGGLRELYRGALITALRDMTGATAFFAPYEAYKHLLRPADSQGTHLGSILLAGGLAGMTSWIVALPFDTLKTTIQTAKPGSPLQLSRSPIRTAARKLWAEAGLVGLYRGLVPVLVRAFPVNAACFFGYEVGQIIKKRLNASLSATTDDQVPR